MDRTEGVGAISKEDAIAYGLTFQDPAVELPAPQRGAGYPVRLEDEVGCDVFTALEVTGFDMPESIS